MFQLFIEKLKTNLQKPLPGVEVQFEMAHVKREKVLANSYESQNYRPSAVLILLYPNEQQQTSVLLIERMTYNGHHSGQIAFPGGKIEKSDASFLHAALRETHEEVGIESNHIQVVGNLTEVFVFASNFMVYPFVGIMQEIPTLALETKEVAAVLEIPLLRFFEDGIIKEKKIKNALGFNLMAPYYDLDNKVLWGATAMMVSELCAVIKQHQIIL